jgi:hypothetical protein
VEQVQHDPLRYAIRWARAVLWQAQRLGVDDRQAPPAGDGDRPGFLERITIDHHFLLVAAVQLERALQAHGTGRGLPPDLRDKLKALRNVCEHWDEWDQERGSARAYRRRWPEQSPYQISLSASRDDILLGGIVRLGDLLPPVRELLSSLEAEKAKRGRES